MSHGSIAWRDAEEFSLQEAQIALGDGKAAIMGAEPGQNVAKAAGAPAAAAEPLCWICKKNKVDSGEQQDEAKRAPGRVGKAHAGGAVLLSRSAQGEPACRQSGDPQVACARICARCNSTRTQPHDRAWDSMSVWPGAAIEIISVQRPRSVIRRCPT